MEIEHLRTTYGNVVAVDDLSFSVAEGEIFGILGPNGAGKTSTVECVLGMRSPDAGSIRVLGPDQAPIARDCTWWRARSCRKAPCRASSGSARSCRSTGPSTGTRPTAPSCPSRWPSSASRRWPCWTR